jgi:SAM-dependent methyltransferase
VDRPVLSRLRVHVFGEGPEDECLREKVNDLGLDGCVRIRPPLGPAELAGWLSRTAGLVIPSRIESIPLVLLDAAQEHCPVIATDVGDMGRLVTEYGLGRRVPPEDPAALATAITEACRGAIPYDRASADRLVSESSLAQTCQRLFQPVDLEDYWERRLKRDFTLRGVGIQRCGLAFNTWGYRLRGERFADMVGRYVTPGARVLDIGSGTGFYIERWQALGAASVRGCDVSRTAVNALRQKFPGLQFDRFDVSGPIPEQFLSDRFDVIDAMDVLWHIVDPAGFERALANLATLLAPDGLFIWTDNFVHRPRAGQSHIVMRTLVETEHALHSAGLEILAREPLFVLMNAPVDSRWTPLWKAVVGAACLTERTGGLMGRLLYEVDRRLVTRLRDSPSTEIMVCRRSG